MCRNIKILRAPYAVGVTDEDVHAAALQYVRTVGGVRLPPPHNEEAFNQAVDLITAVTRDLLAGLEAGQQHLVASPDPAAIPGNLEASPEHGGSSPERRQTSPEPLEAAPGQPGGLVAHPPVTRGPIWAPLAAGRREAAPGSRRMAPAGPAVTRCAYGPRPPGRAR